MMKKISSRYAVIFLITTLFHCISLGQEIVINEVMPDNATTIQDEDGDYPDWIEIYNNSSIPLNLQNYRLSDDPDNPEKWLFPEVNIPEKGYKIIFASGKNRFDTNYLHTNFKVDANSEVVFLYDSQGSLIDSIESNKLEEDESFGRLPDGMINTVKLFRPTPESSNNLNNALSSSINSGFYTNPEYLEFSAIINDSIYYTLDGSIPTLNSNYYNDPILLDYKYKDPNYFCEIPTSPPQQLIAYKAWESPGININKAHIIRSASFRNGIRTSKIYTQTYFIDSLIFEKYSLPVISIITDSENLFNSDSGIYVPGIFYDPDNPEWSGNYFREGENWERPVYIEYFETNGEPAFSQDAGVRIHGGKTRCAAQKSLKLYSRKEYGKKYFDYPLLPHRPNQQYKRFLLRTSMGAWGGETIISDVLAHVAVKELNVEYQDYQPVILFINGEYWGIHTIRDRIDERYIAYQYGIDKDSIDLIGGNYNLVYAGSNQAYVDLIAFIEQHALSEQANYEYVKSQIDIDNYIDYQIAEMFFKNYDWPSNNVKIWRSQANGKWRWIFYDIDAGFGDYNYNMFEHATLNDDNVTWPNSPASTFLFRNLLKNNGFKSQFISRYAEILNGEFSVTELKDKLMALKTLYGPEVHGSSQRWHYPENETSWENDITESLELFIEERPCSVEQNIMTYFNLTTFDFHCERTVNEKGASEQIIVAPNPSRGLFFVLNNSTETIKGSLSISDPRGNIIYRDHQLTLNAGDREYINLTTLSANLYFLNFNLDKGPVNKKVILH